MATLIRSITLEDQPVVLGMPKRVVLEGRVQEMSTRETSIAPMADADSIPSEAVSAGESLSAYAAPDMSAPIPEESRYTHEEFHRQFEAELATLREQAVHEGLEKGQALGKAEAVAEYSAQLEVLATVITSMRQSLEGHIEGVSDIAVEIVFEAVAKIVGERMADRETVLSTVREVIRHAKERSRLIARVAPQDYEWLMADSDRLVDGLNTGEVEIVADERVQLGGCLLETPAGNLDGRLEIQLQQLRDALLNARSR